MLPSHIAVQCQTRKMQQPPQYSPSLTGVALSLVQIKYTFWCLQAFTMTELWLKQPKILPCLTVDVCQTIGRCPNHHKCPTNKPSLTDVALSLVQIKYTYPCLHDLLWLNIGWSSQKCCPAMLLLSAKNLQYITTTKLLQINLPWLVQEWFLDQVKYTNKCLSAFIMTEHWLKQPKM